MPVNVYVDDKLIATRTVSIPVAATTSISVVWIAADTGIHKIIVKIDEGDVLPELNETNNQDTVGITVRGVLIADANGPYVGYENAPITFNGSGSIPNEDIVTWFWDLDGDGLYETNATATQGIVDHTWEDDYSGNVSLKVMDRFGECDIDDSTVTVFNVAPTVEAGATQTVAEGDLVSFDGSFIDPGTKDTHRIEWDFGDGSTTRDTLASTHTYSARGIYEVTLQVTDDDGEVGTDTLNVTVTSPAVKAKVVIKPETINLKSRGIFMAFIQLPKGYNAAHINSKTVVCEGAPALAGFGFRNTFIAWFNIQKLVDVPTGDAVTLTVTGKFFDGALFEGSDTVRVIDRGWKK